jgi:hypothetical protein
MKNFRLPISDFRLKGGARPNRSPILKSAIGNRQSAIAFTLTEVLIVIGIIVLVLAMAVPAFNFISGSRSIEGGENVCTAMLGPARNLAISTGSFIGVAFYLDPVTERTTLAVVKVGEGLISTSTDSPFLDQYKAWRTGFAYPAGARVIFMTRDTTETPPSPQGKLLTKIYERLDFDIGNTTQSPVTSGPSFDNTHWALVVEGTLQTPVDEGDIQMLPPGVGAQLLNDPRGNTLLQGWDRYVRIGVIVFDPQGKLAYIPYTIPATSAVGKALGLTSAINPPSANQLYSQFGVVLYDRQTFLGQTGHSEQDMYTGLPSGFDDTTETSEEIWLDENSTLLMINRVNGTLMTSD